MHVLVVSPTDGMDLLASQSNSSRALLESHALPHRRIPGVPRHSFSSTNASKNAHDRASLASVGIALREEPRNAATSSPIVSHCPLTALPSVTRHYYTSTNASKTAHGSLCVIWHRTAREPQNAVTHPRRRWGGNRAHSDRFCCSTAPLPGSQLHTARSKSRDTHA